MKVFYPGRIVDLRQILKDGFPPGSAGPFYFNEGKAVQLTEARDMNYLEITIPGKRSQYPKGAQAFSAPAEEINKCKRRMGIKIVGVSALSGGYEDSRGFVGKMENLPVIEALLKVDPQLLTRFTHARLSHMIDILRERGLPVTVENLWAIAGD